MSFSCQLSDISQDIGYCMFFGFHVYVNQSAQNNRDGKSFLYICPRHMKDRGCQRSVRRIMRLFTSELSWKLLRLIRSALDRNQESAYAYRMHLSTLDEMIWKIYFRINILFQPMIFYFLVWTLCFSFFNSVFIRLQQIFLNAKIYSILNHFKEEKFR